VTELDPAGFLADLESKPKWLRRLADGIRDEDPWSGLPASARRFVLLGMGSSHYACATVAARLRALGIAAVAELGSADLLPPPTADTVVVAVSASGGSVETQAAVDRYLGRCPVAVVTNVPDSPMTAGADLVVPMHAGPEIGGVACRTYQHTLALLLALEERLDGARRTLGATLRGAADASADLLDRRDEWLPEIRERLAGPDGVYVAAPARRLSSAHQAALMLREGPRLPAAACETGDWSHVDVYLTKTLDYRLLLLAGSPWEEEMLRWTSERESTVVAVGADVSAAAQSIRYVGDESDDVCLLTESLVAELLAQDLWSRP
jgi:fructoselysine-6-P-deglycase FrlB-like protein